MRKEQTRTGSVDRGFPKSLSQRRHYSRKTGKWERECGREVGRNAGKPVEWRNVVLA